MLTQQARFHEQRAWRNPNGRSKGLRRVCLVKAAQKPQGSRKEQRRCPQAHHVGKCRSQCVFVHLGILCPASSAHTPSCTLLRSQEILLCFPFVRVLSFQMVPLQRGIQGEIFPTQLTMPFVLFCGVDHDGCVGPGQENLSAYRKGVLFTTVLLQSPAVHIFLEAVRVIK